MNLVVLYFGSNHVNIWRLYGSISVVCVYLVLLRYLVSLYNLLFLYCLLYIFFGNLFVRILRIRYIPSEVCYLSVSCLGIPTDWTYFRLLHIHCKFKWKCFPHLSAQCQVILVRVRWVSSWGYIPLELWLNDVFPFDFFSWATSDFCLLFPLFLEFANLVNIFQTMVALVVSCSLQVSTFT